MKKRTLDAFTLVEMLIVIVIIGILIAALLPRMQAAQGRARDVSRKTALSQIQSAIVVYQGDHGMWPLEKASEGKTCTDEEKEQGCEDVPAGTAATNGIGVNSISKELKESGMSSIPADPLKAKVSGLGDFTGDDDGNYGYLVGYRNGTEKGGFALMAKTEVVGGSNWVVCDTQESNGKLTGGTDLANIKTCEEIGNGSCSNDGQGNCSYQNDGELRYLITY